MAAREQVRPAQHGAISLKDFNAALVQEARRVKQHAGAAKLPDGRTVRLDAGRAKTVVLPP